MPINEVDLGPRGQPGPLADGAMTDVQANFVARDILALELMARDDRFTEAQEIAIRLATVLNIGEELAFQSEHYLKKVAQRIAESN